MAEREECERSVRLVLVGEVSLNSVAPTIARAAALAPATEKNLWLKGGALWHHPIRRAATTVAIAPDSAAGVSSGDG